METAIPGLHASTSEGLSFAPSLHVRSFLLQRPAGNVLVYGPRTIEPDAQAVDELGGISRQYLNHRHEASPSSDWVAERFGAPLHVHEADAASVAKTSAVGATFASRHVVDGDLEVIPTPGHTSGATAYLWDSAQHRMLFTGDTIYLRDGEWVAAVLEFSDRERYIESLELIRGLDFDVLVPWAASAGNPYYAVVENGDARARIDAILERVRRGESS
jgi:Metallo-beta-lactamase superfamily